ncbi:MAG TPA: prenyltransferase/squalene oxidase repeat-containing protein [Planctomycetaceae bacterium]|nr:prenyltransferase/squalene oxidase repeat-containing protein [Planctomycetaceae bacterium]
MRAIRTLTAIAVALALCGRLPGEDRESAEPTPHVGEAALDPERIKAAVTKSIALLEHSGAEYRRHRECFSCHNQALPVTALAEARRRGFTIDEDNFRAQLDHTSAHLERGREAYLKGIGQGGKADTAGYALWTLEEGGRGPDENTAAVTSFLLDWQKDNGHWKATSQRPPSEASAFTTTYLAIRALGVFGTDEQGERIAERRSAVVEWLKTAEPKDTEDRVFRLRLLGYLGADESEVQAATRELLEFQQDDGGWSQTAELSSDAYATATVLVALNEYGGVEASDPAWRRGIAFVLNTQQDDGSWHVASRSKPFQTYFETGFPHGKDQFISAAASSWATLGLLYALEAVK